MAYVVPSRDEQTERTVDPLRLLTAEGRPYLEAWCHRVADVRLFRLDRIVSAQVEEALADRHEHVARRDLSAGLFQPGPGDVLAVVDLDESARWVAEYYPIEGSEERPEGGLRVRMRVADAAWLRRLVLRHGGAARVVAPAEVAEEVRHTAVAALAGYAP